MFKCAELLNNNEYKNINNEFNIIVKIDDYIYINVNTDITEIKYYLYLLNLNRIDNYNYNDIISNEKFTYNEDVLNILLNYKNKNVIINKLYNYVVKNINDNMGIYVFNYGLNKDKMYNTPITYFYVNNTKLFKFIIKILENLLNHPNVNTFYENKPSLIKYINNNSIDLMYDKTEGLDNLLKNIEYILTTLDNIDSILKNNNNYMFSVERELFENNMLSYYVILNSLIKFNKFHLEEVIIDNIKNITIYKVEYNDKSISDKFDLLLDKESFNIGWHGSNVLNWYSILYNGIKSGGEKNVKIVNGSAYGNGIYMSDNCMVSLPYSSLPQINNSTVKNNINKKPDNMLIMGLFQVKGGLTQYKKGASIYVVKKSEDVCMRYLLVETNSSLTTNSVNLNNYFIKNHVSTTNLNNINIKKRGNGRILKEISLMEKYNMEKDNDNSLIMSFNVQDNINNWICKLHKDNFKEKNLYQDMVNYDVENIVIKVLLPDKYPFDPPFIHIISPILNISKKGNMEIENITSGGSICMDLLTKQHWLSSICIDKIILMIKLYILDNDLRINNKMLGKEYSYKNAVDSYNDILVRKI